MGLDTISAVVVGSVAGGLVGLGLAGAAWRNRDVPAATPFGWLVFAIGGWCLLTTALLASTGRLEAYVFDLLARLVSTTIPPLGLTFFLAYAGHDRWLAPRRLALVWAYPAAYAVLTVTAPVHGLASTPADVAFRTVGGVTAPVVAPGPIDQVELGLSYVLFALAYFVLFRLLVRTRAVHRRQALALGVGTLLPVATNAAFTLGASVHPGVNLTPLSFVLSGVALGWGLYRYDFLSVTPLASDVLVDELPDPMLVLDEDDRVVDHNAVAAAAFGADAICDGPVEDVAPGLLDAVAAGTVYRLPNRLATDGGPPRYYDPLATEMSDQHDTTRGRLILLRDVTGQQRRQDRLEALHAATQRFFAAETHERIAGLTANFVGRALGREAAVYLTNDAGAGLSPVAATEDVEDALEGAGPVSDADHPIVDAYERREATSVDGSDVGLPFRRTIALPLGEHGVLAIGTGGADSLSGDDEQFAAILARTTQVALGQVARENELRRHQTSLERRNEQIAFFQGVLHHRLRNALLVIRGRSDHLGDHVDRDERRHLEVIAEWCDDLATLSEEIRAINDTATATERERFVAVDLSCALRTQARAVADDHDDVTVSVDVDDGLRILADELVDRVLENALNNALQHNDGDDRRVAVTARRVADRIQVRVADNGPGISDDLKATVFERDVGPTQTRDGFGLNFVSVVMNLYGGTVWFEDNEPRGTVAVLEFRAADE